MIRHIYPEAAIPQGRLPNRQLTEERREANRLLSQDRVVVERFFGRMKGYCGISQKPCRSEHSSLEVLARIVVCLTNLKLREAPLFADEDVCNPSPTVNEEGEKTETTA